MNTTQKAQYLADAIDTPEALGRLTKPSWRGMLHSNSRLAVVGLILQGVSLMNASAAKDKAMAHEDTELGVRLWNTRAMMMGAVGELVGEATMYTRAGQISLFRGMNMSSLFRVGGRVLGGAAGIVMAGVDGYKAWEEYRQGDRGIAVLYAVSSIGGLVFGIALLAGAAWLTGGVAIIFIVILIGISVLISLFTDNEIQEWLERCYWGELDADQRYQSLDEQHRQLNAVLG